MRGIIQSEGEQHMLGEGEQHRVKGNNGEGEQHRVKGNNTGCSGGSRGFLLVLKNYPFSELNFFFVAL